MVCRACRRRWLFLTVALPGLVSARVSMWAKRRAKACERVIDPLVVAP